MYELIKMASDFCNHMQLPPSDVKYLIAEPFTCEVYKKLNAKSVELYRKVESLEAKLQVAEHLLEGIRHLEIMDFENPLNYQTSIRNSIASYKIKAK